MSIKMPLMDLPAHQVLQQIHCLNTSLPAFHDQLNDALHAKGYEECVPSLGDDDIAWLVDYLEKVIRPGSFHLSA